MSEASRSPHQQAISSLQASGFPFQTAVAAAVASMPGWAHLAQEFPWTDPAGVDQFLDLVVWNREQIFGLECKKTQKDTLTFLVPRPDAREIESLVCLRASQIADATRRMELENEEWPVAPLSYEAAFCVVSSEPGRNARLLERDCQLLVRGLDAFAQGRQEQFHPETHSPIPSAALYVPVLVTTAPLFLQQYDPASVSLSTGTFDPHPRNLVAVPWIRFRKTFTSEHGPHMGERTVIVVAATALAQFLLAFRPTSTEPLSYFGRLSRRPRRP